MSLTRGVRDAQLERDARVHRRFIAGQQATCVLASTV
jgi:hypothetical protein